jgi:arylsulfatase A-like enzyme
MALLRRNLLIVLCHGLRSDAIGDTGVWPLSTPHLDQLAQRGARLTTTSACPADPGGMISLLTALHARQHGVTSPTRETVRCDGWPMLFADAGIHMAGVGCIESILPHLAKEVTVCGPDEMDEDRCAYLRLMRDMDMLPDILQQRRERKRSGLMDPMPVACDPGDDIDGFIAMQAMDMLQDMPVDRQWALVVIFSGPGNDLPPPSMYDQVVEPRLLESDFMPADLKQVDALAELDYPRVMLQRLTAKKIGRIRADYLGRVSMIDYAVGQLMQRVADRADSDRTWTVMGSDRGHLLGEHGLVGHRSFLSAAVEVPAIIAPPTPASAIRVDDPVSNVDLAATIALLGGCDLTLAMSGRSLLPLLKGEPIFPASPGGAVISEYGHRLMLETDRYKVVFDHETRDAIGLFDLLEDPQEKKNLIGTPHGSNLLDAMRWRLGDALLPLRSA